MQKESCNSTAEEGCCQFKGVLFSLFPSLFLVHDYMFCVMYIDGFNDRRDSLRKFGYSLRGKRTQAQKLVARGHVSAICAMSLSGILECQFENGSVNHETFRNLIEKSLLPHLMPFNGTNEHSVVIMDNVAIHHVKGISELIKCWCIGHFLTAIYLLT